MNKSSLNFLVVDDDESSREIVKELLVSFGYEHVFEADNGEKALEYLKGHSVDFVICDWEMPGLNGLELLRLIRKDEQLKHVFFIMITSPISREKMKIKDAATSLVDSYLIKPFRGKLLERKISEFLFEKEWKSHSGAIIADDDTAVRELITEIVKQQGLSPIYVASDGQEAWRLLEEHRAEVGLMISDWEMPNLSGIDLLRKVRTTASSSNLPFIMVTSQRSFEVLKIKKAAESEVDQYLIKPFRPADMIQRIKQVTGKAKTEAFLKFILNAARKSLEMGELEDAEEQYSEVLSRNSDNIDALLGLASIERSKDPLNGYPESVRLIQKAISLDPANPRSHIELATVYESVKALEKAINYLQKVTETYKDSAELHYHLGCLLVRRGRVEEGCIELSRAVDLDPSHKDAREILGRSIDKNASKKGKS